MKDEELAQLMAILIGGSMASGDVPINVDEAYELAIGILRRIHRENLPDEP
jgi:hypothetical protein